MSDTTSTAIDLSRLPVPPVIEPLSYETIFAEMAAELKIYFPEFNETRESDPAVKILQLYAYRRLLDRQRVNDAAKALMLAYAQKGDLDQLGALVNVARLLIMPADPANNIDAVYESDADFRERIQLAPEGFSVAGPRGAYLFHARSADADVKDAAVDSPSPGEVVVTVLSRSNNGAASADLLTAVDAVLSAETVRPLTDHVTVQAASIVEYPVIASIKTYAGPDAAVVLAEAQTRATALAETLNRLGRDVTRAAYIAAIHTSGVQNTVLTSPAADMVISPTQASRCTGIIITHAGIDE